MDAMFDVLGTGHRHRERFGPAFGEHRQLLDTLLERALQSDLIDTDWQFIGTRSALEIGRYSIYPETTNYGRVRQAVDSIRSAYADDDTLRPIWLRVLAELDYKRPPRTVRTNGTCDWYGGAGGLQRQFPQGGVHGSPRMLGELLPR